MRKNFLFPNLGFVFLVKVGSLFYYHGKQRLYNYTEHLFDTKMYVTICLYNI